MIEIYLLEQLVSFSKYGTLSATAEHLHISQPAVTNSMKKIEKLMGVPLFERRKNKITLNENGQLAAELAENILEQIHEMMTRVISFDKSKHTITLGSCAPVPVSDIVPILSRLYPDMTISSELKIDESELLIGLQDDRYQVIVVHKKPLGQFYKQPYRKEQLYLMVPLNHPLSKYNELHLSDIDGQNLLLYTNIGFWNNMCKEHLTNSHFLMMDEMSVMGEAISTGAFPSFTSNIMMKENDVPNTHKTIPIVDEEAQASYYCVCKPENKKRFSSLFHEISQIDNN